MVETRMERRNLEHKPKGNLTFNQMIAD